MKIWVNLHCSGYLQVNITPHIKDTARASRGPACPSHSNRLVSPYTDACSTASNHIFPCVLISWKALMDGTRPVEVVRGLVYPGGISVDHISASLFWADHDTNRIQSSGLDGRRVKTFVQMASKTGPWGIGFHNGRIFWGNWQAKYPTYWTNRHLDVSSGYPKPSLVENPGEPL